MLLQTIACAALAGIAFGKSAADAMMDNVLKDMSIQTGDAGLDPAFLDPFALSVKAGTPKLDFEANFTQVTLFGLGELERRGNCEYGFSGGDLKMACYVSLDHLCALTRAEVKGDQSDEFAHSISTSSDAPKSFLRIKFAGGPGTPARLLPMTIGPIQLTTTLTQGNVNLDPTHFYDFQTLAGRKIAQEVVRILAGKYSSILQDVASRYRMP
ncbi:uncharacterized protein LOC100904643 [Galendromus occidentalis]|uniref:Uncharacterized protein LOC100904643 n=1 Tax=Galendromus occidentalis TaxID=34638 RepID=A0AAJ6QPB0_9ACAR|nr:uncharacterized protein LOC100904643 [Galendromus occidentalis]